MTDSEFAALLDDLSKALRLLALVKEWRDSEGNEPFPHDLRERIEERLAAHKFSWHARRAPSAGRAAAPRKGVIEEDRPSWCVECGLTEVEDAGTKCDECRKGEP